MFTKRVRRLVGIGIVFALIACTGWAQDVLYVDGDAPPGGDGSNWGGRTNAPNRVGRALPDMGGGDDVLSGGARPTCCARMGRPQRAAHVRIGSVMVKARLGLSRTTTREFGC